ncbi:MAG: rhodanese-like domain-containing protein, partial [Vicinamibacterales bacterium]
MSRCLFAAFWTVLALGAAVPRAGAQTAPPARGLLFSTAELATALKDPDVVILHVADRPSVFEEGHIPGARFVRYADFAVDGGQGLGSELPSVAEIQRIFRAVGVSNGSRVVVYGVSPV